MITKQLSERDTKTLSSVTEVRTGDTKNTADTGFILAKIYLYLTLRILDVTQVK